ncbi:MAG: cupredoxin domain-containing protein [Actinomycetota bacterium]|nr:cupredoxin domain-containing protein [Actinomycetota bacterium]
MIVAFRLVAALGALVMVAATMVFGAPATQAAGASGKTITITDKVSPKHLSVAPGTTVTWVNEDDDKHRMAAEDGAVEFDSGNIEPGERWSHTFTKVGNVNYFDDRDDENSAYFGMIMVERGAGSGGGSGGGGAGGGGGSAPAAKGAVSIGDDFFSPRDLKVAVGGTVTWTNNGDDQHSATGSGFDSGSLNAGERWTKKFTSAGTYDYVCVYHSDMTGTITVGDGGSGGGGAGGGGGGGEQPPPPGGGGTQPPPPGDGGGGGTTAPGTASVKVGDDFFSPKTVSVRAGGTVTWTNNGKNPHTVTGSGFDSGMMTGGQKFTKTFAKAGTYSYECAYHSGMTGTLKVVNAKGEAPPRGDGPGGGGNGGGANGPGGTGGAGGRTGGGGGGGGATAPGSQTHTVTMGASSFSPKVLSARVGDKVVFKNASSLPHNVAPLTTSPIMGGQSYTTVLRKQGTLNYECQYHSGMTGTIKVGAAPAGTKLPPASAAEGVSGAASGASAATPSGSSGGSSAAPAPGAESHTISMVNSTFDPQTLQARVGDKVTWVNDDPIPHNVTGGPLDSGMMMGGAEYTTVLTEAGTIEYDCTLHPGMTGTLEVAEALPGTEVPAASSSNTSGSAGAASDSGQPSASAKPEEGAKNHTVEMVNFLYEPDPLEVNVGDTVTFVNKDAAPHTATADDKSWDSGNMNQGDEWTLKTDKVGEVPYICIYHPNMTGTLIVKPADAEIAAPGTGSGATPDTVSTMSVSDIAGFSSGWLVLLAFLAGLQLQSRLTARRGYPTQS